MIRFSTLDVEMPPIEPQRVKAWIESVAQGYGKTIGELYYYFCSDERLLEINRDRLGHDFYTDIVTFPLTDCETVLSSEFCISIDRIKENATTFGRSYESELHRVIIHGVSTACCILSASTTLPMKKKKKCVKKRKRR